MKFSIFAAAALVGLVAPVMSMPVVDGDALIARDASTDQAEATPATPAAPEGAQPFCHPWEWWCHNEPPRCKPWEWWCHNRPPRCKPWEWWCH
ncbi:hypothetical protein LshimejAT787_1600830 [Lyophyllum shimeji]|uniref:Uncharacterized protein n=1 Tax=Lyophyllum shimeji TaxID=47721 RepID=A0A9P3UT08_LYOSH|nr:hypothetical protein LshimejAT787_1600830 [Lyophyllum shimeji]